MNRGSCQRRSSSCCSPFASVLPNQNPLQQEEAPIHNKYKIHYNQIQEELVTQINKLNQRGTDFHPLTMHNEI